MQVLLYNELDPHAIEGFAKWQKLMEADDLKSADVKKIGDNLYRARLNRSDRLLLAFHHYQGERYALVLEYLKNHDYAGSRFLRGVTALDEERIPPLEQLPTDVPPLTYINPQHGHFNLLDKIISFDDAQRDVLALQPPLVLIGSAGSGKTALVLEKMKAVQGRVLYVTLSPYLVKNSRDLYYANRYENDRQAVDFLSFQEFLESIQMPEGKPLEFRDFDAWFKRLPRPPVQDAHKLFEEFRGVLTGQSVEATCLSQEEYLELGVKQSIFLEDERPVVYELFNRYLALLQDKHFYDANILSQQYLQKIRPVYDFVVVDEVQDLTNVQLFLILHAVHNPAAFMLCGDSNQIVHPNFFSWSSLKGLFFRHADWQADTELVRILSANYRNSLQVTELANRILLLKNIRFGSTDRESSYLVKSHGHVQGRVMFLQDCDTIRRELDAKTRVSTRFAVVVMHDAQKAEAQQHFNTPLVFSIHEAKGLEYENIILYNFLSAERKRFQEISQGVTQADLQQGLTYSRARDKTDKSLETYKFYINALYVALTRAIRNLYWIESDSQQPLLALLGLDNAADMLDIEHQDSGIEEWQREANKLELQGKQEQAARIRREILQRQQPDWEVYTGDTLGVLYQNAMSEGNKQARLALFEYALVYDDRQILRDLWLSGFKPARTPANGIRQVQQKYFLSYLSSNSLVLNGKIKQFGVDFRNLFNQTPLMSAVWLGNGALVSELVKRGADTGKVNNRGFSVLQIALQRASNDTKYARHMLEGIYADVKPGSLSVQVDGRLLKLEWNSMEFFLLNLMVALFYRLLPGSLNEDGGGFTAQDIAAAVADFPQAVLPEHRKQRAYISNILSKNEMNGNDPYSCKLFLRIRQGHYVFNPILMLKLEGEWVNIYDMLRVDRLADYPDALPAGWHVQDQMAKDQACRGGLNMLQERLQQVRMVLLNDALSVLRLLCEQELQKIQGNVNS